MPVQVERREEEELGATERQWVTLSPAEPVSTQEQGVPGGGDEAVIPADPRVYAQADPQKRDKRSGKWIPGALPTVTFKLVEKVYLKWTSTGPSRDKEGERALGA